jgi:hypothetical protein
MRFTQILACGVLGLVAVETRSLDPRSRIGHESVGAVVPNVIVTGATGALDPEPVFPGRPFQRSVLFFGRYSNSGPNSFGGILKCRRIIVIFFQAGSLFAAGIEILRRPFVRFLTKIHPSQCWLAV